MGGIVVLKFRSALGALDWQELMDEGCQHGCDDSTEQHEVADGLDVGKCSGNVDSGRSRHYDESDGDEPFCPTVLCHCHHFIFSNRTLRLTIEGSPVFSFNFPLSGRW